MSRFLDLTMCACGAALLLLAVTFTPVRQSVDGIVKAAGGNLTSVVVTNTTANPVPVAAQGTTNIAGNVGVTSMPAVSLAGGTTVGVSSMPAVSLDSTGNAVQVANTVANPVAVTNVNDAQQPFQAKTDVQLVVGSNVAGNVPLATVPIGKRLVIESMSLNGFVPAGQKLENAILTANCTGSATICVWSIVPTDEGPWSGSELFGAFQQGRVYVDAGHTILASASRSDIIGAGTATINISGYLVNVPN
jgi:hypothetical protein